MNSLAKHIFWSVYYDTVNTPILCTPTTTILFTIDNINGEKRSLCVHTVKRLIKSAVCPFCLTHNSVPFFVIIHLIIKPFKCVKNYFFKEIFNIFFYCWQAPITFCLGTNIFNYIAIFSSKILFSIAVILSFLKTRSFSGYIISVMNFF